jgi:hypothetical protein
MPTLRSNGKEGSNFDHEKKEKEPDQTFFDTVQIFNYRFLFVSW